jgi:hypothetical protein
MQLKLAEYKDGKFERFLELGKDFVFGGEYIIITGLNLDKLREDPRYYDLDTDLTNISIYPLDKKDPLNRFDGLFDGRTYGGGGFVLLRGFQVPIECQVDLEFVDEQYKEDFINEAIRNKIIDLNIHWQDSVYKRKAIYSSKIIWDVLSILPEAGNNYGSYPDAFEFPRITYSCDSGALRLIEEAKFEGNLHQNPELYEKIK